MDVHHLHFCSNLRSNCHKDASTSTLLLFSAIFIIWKENVSLAEFVFHLLIARFLQNNSNCTILNLKIFPLPNFSKFAIECDLKISQICTKLCFFEKEFDFVKMSFFLLNWSFFKKIPKLGWLRKFNEGRVFSQKRRFHSSKKHLQQSWRAVNMTVVTGRVVNYSPPYLINGRKIIHSKREFFSRLLANCMRVWIWKFLINKS